MEKESETVTKTFRQTLERRIDGPNLGLGVQRDNVMKMGNHLSL